MTLQGKGFMIWKINSCEGGNPDSIASVAQAAGLTHVLIKIADGSYVYNYDRTNNVDLIPPVVQALRNKGIGVWGWHYVYGADPTGEARIAISQINKYNLDGYVIDAEAEYKASGKSVAARSYMSTLRASLPSLPIALCSYRYPTYHPQLPWTEFLEKCDINMPQVYWEQAHNAGAQLERSVREFAALTPNRPVMPTGPAYGNGGWVPTASEVGQFLATAKTLNLSSANFFSWDYARAKLQDVWATMSAFSWENGTTTLDIVDQWINAMNSHNAATVAALYTGIALHISRANTVQGSTGIQAYYTNLFTSVLPGATFQLTGIGGTGASRHFTWTATASNGKKVQNGSDSIGLINGKIAYHYTHFDVT